MGGYFSRERDHSTGYYSFQMLNSFEATAQATLRVQPAAVRLAHARGRCINVFEGVINLRMLHC